MTTIYLEQGKTRVVAFAWEWPGWCRYGKTPEQALAALHACTARYAGLVEQAELPFEETGNDEVVAIAGTSNTDWAPSVILAADQVPQSGEDGARRVRLLQTAWHLLQQTLSTSSPMLRKGPRGGGRDRDQLAEHVFAAERSYARKIGIRQPEFVLADQTTLTRFHEVVAVALSAATDGAPLAPNGWPTAYALRRFTWHVVDHLWEMEDRQE